MREIVINVYCDMCLGQGHTNMVPEHEAVHVKLTFSDGEREMDLCPECTTDIVSISRADVEAKPKKLKKGESPWVYEKDYGFDSSNDPKPWGCNYCPTYCSTEQGIKQHLSRTHKELHR